MSDSHKPEDQAEDSGIRRLSPKDHKPRIEAELLRFPDEPELPPPPPEFEALFGPARDDEPPPVLPADAVRPLIITPQSERFPPVRPEDYRISSPRPPSKQRPAPRPHKRSPMRHVYNLITLLSLLGTAAIVALFVVIWNDPETEFNPFPPPTPFIEVTATPRDAIGITAPTPEPTSTSTSIPIAGPALSTPGPRAVVTATDDGFPFAITDVGVLYTQNDNGRGCNWASIAGTVTARDGAPLDGYAVRIRDEEGQSERVFSGATRTFGPGGFELPLSGAPRISRYTVQLFSPQGAPLSDSYTVETRAECDSSVAIVSFMEN